MKRRRRVGHECGTRQGGGEPKPCGEPPTLLVLDGFGDLEQSPGPSQRRGGLANIPIIPPLPDLRVLGGTRDLGET